MIDAFATNLKTIQNKIQTISKQYAQKHDIKSHNIKLIAVSKYHSIDEILAMHSLGQNSFGENKVQDLKTKISQIDFSKNFEWHFIGSLQRNKINTLLSLNPALIHSIDSLNLAYEIDKKCKQLGKIQPILLQVNSANEPSKHGFDLKNAKEAFLKIKESTTNLNLCGIMTIGAHSEDKSKIEDSFARTKKLHDSLEKYGSSVLSMGMSGDFELALQNGANMLRIGSALFRH
ncbi:YggS family pyridoxal phosphate-dependent enzyme [Helicobacter sp. T3_23-1056]